MYDESVTCNTVFHDLKMPIKKAFQMMFRVVTKKKGISTVELGTEVGVQQKTAWFFKRKIQISLLPAKSVKLENKVEMDETLVGGYCAGEQGRSHEGKQAVMVAIEKLDDGRVGNIALKHIDNFETNTFHQAADEMIDPAAQITTDDFPSWKALKQELPDLKTKKSN
jgi:ISXO2-like transposase domain